MSEEQKKPFQRIRIQNDGQPGCMTKITDADTGKELEWQTFRVTLDASYKELPLAIVYVYLPVVDMIVDAKIRHVCPCCGRAVEEPG